MKRKKDAVLPAAAEYAQTAAERVGPAAQRAADVVGPYAQQAADKISPYAHQAADKLGPYAHQAADKISPYAHQAADKISPYAHQAADKLAPYAEDAKQRGASAAHQALEKFGPKLDDALDRVTPAVDAARDKVQSDLLPRLNDTLAEAANSPAATEARKRGEAVAAALAGELEVAKPKKKRRWVKRIAIVAAVGGAAAFLAKKFLGSQDSEWQAPRPTNYTPTRAATPSTPASAPTSTPPRATDTADTSAPATAAGEPKDVTASEESNWAPAADSPAADTETAAPTEKVESPHGEGSYVGQNPPEGFIFKGNERSMKYHGPDSPSYEGTKAEVWFTSEAAAEAAGFSKASR
ncbi:MAG: sunset domain-containing protein [Propionibacteriaceae bacterium]